MLVHFPASTQCAVMIPSASVAVWWSGCKASALTQVPQSCLSSSLIEEHQSSERKTHIPGVMLRPKEVPQISRRSNLYEK